MPFTYIEYDSNARLWPGVRRAYELVDRYQLVNSYGLFRRMTGVGGRPEVVIEGSNDQVSWTVRGKKKKKILDDLNVCIYKHAAQLVTARYCVCFFSLLLGDRVHV